MKQKTESRKVVRLTALDFAATLTGKDFDTVFCQIAGWIADRAKNGPGVAYKVEEVAELFNMLFDMRVGRTDETPAAGTAGES